MERADTAEKDDISKVPATRLIAPVKPTSERLMTSLKATIRQRRLGEMILAQPKPVEGVEVTPITLTTWHEYENQKAKYQGDLSEFQRPEKIAALKHTQWRTKRPS